MADLLFNLDRVTAMEHLLKSVLLYPLNNSAASSSTVTCVWDLGVKGPMSSGQGSPKSAKLACLEETQMDVTSLLQTLVASSERSIHMCVKFTNGQALRTVCLTCLCPCLPRSPYISVTPVRRPITEGIPLTPPGGLHSILASAAWLPIQ